MNFIELNGVRSNYVKGLIIQELPPITKPGMRTTKEEIDGRDGDIITKLGYSAYDKEMTIGLYGDYDIDDVIRFFDSEGEVVFSNEPDKYYIYQILDQIDYERLIRFRTAKIKMHVQPFKYDAVCRELIITGQLIELDPWNSVKNSVSVSVANGIISVNGTASRNTEFYIPIDNIIPTSGNYTLTANTSGIASGCAIRLISNSPSNANSFGGNYVSLKSNASASLTADDTGTKTYNYLWLYIPDQTACNASITATLTNNNFNNFELRNRGNTTSRPKLTIYGYGDVELALNGRNILKFNIDESYITIDSANMNAYHDGTLKNRQVIGDYSELALNAGENLLSWNGNVTEIKIEDYSRWI